MGSNEERLEERLSVRSAWIARSALVCWIVFVMVALAAAQDKVVIPYQGLLVDSDREPVNSDEPLTLVFRIYETSVGGTVRWKEIHEDVSVVGGRFSVLLGDRHPFPDAPPRGPLGVLVGRTMYVGVTVDNGDRDVADVEMRPRQAIVPVVASRWAVDADHAAVADRALAADHAAVADRALAADRAILADRVLGEVPVGGVVMFHGDPAELPTNWLLCDGRMVDDPDSPLSGKMVPDLRGLFVRGASDGSAGGISGGDYVPSHNHSLNYTVGGGSGDSRAHRTGMAGGHDNRPRHMELHYIIRIR